MPGHLIPSSVRLSTHVRCILMQILMQILEMVQHRAARYILHRYERTASVKEMLEQLDWETLEQRRRKARLTMLYKMHYNLVEIDHQKYLEPAGRSSRHMHKFSYKVPASNTNYHLFSFFPNTIRDWNSLPLNVVEVQSVNSFRAKLDMF